MEALSWIDYITAKSNYEREQIKGMASLEKELTIPYIKW